MHGQRRREAGILREQAEEEVQEEVQEEGEVQGNQGRSVAALPFPTKSTI